ncbi:MAG: electron transport complex subunit RsxC [Pseudomonadota bacterium]
MALASARHRRFRIIAFVAFCKPLLTMAAWNALAQFFPAAAGRTWQLHGGLHLPDHKALANLASIQPAGWPPTLVLPLSQHIGEAARPLVKPGDKVRKGQMIAKAEGWLSAPLHAPTSGRVSALEDRPVPHPSGQSAVCLVIEPDGLDQWADLPPPLADFAKRPAAELLARIAWAGLVGQGGATFPAAVKLAPRTPVHTLILNGAECEPYISCDDRLMRERPGRVLAGAAILRHILGVERCLIGIEDNKPEAIAALRQALRESGDDATRLVVVPTLYPSGGEKQLIWLLTGQKVPSGGLPAQVGMVCQNVATASAAADAVLDGRPMISRIVTLAGARMARPGNWEVPIGIPVAELIAQAGGDRSPAEGLIAGGPMMGFYLHSDTIPITKGLNCLLALSAQEAPDPGPALACIRCGRCAEVCPVRLLPQQLYWYARAKEFDKTREYHLADCIECGCCAQVCPSHIPLVHYYRFAKTELAARDREKREAEQARIRYEAHLARQERERQAKQRQRPATPAPTGEAEAAAKRVAIEAALKRVADRKATERTHEPQK